MNEDKKLESMISMLYFQSEVETENEDAEKFSAYSLNTPEEPYKKESVALYGLQAVSYTHLDVYKRQS